MDVKENTLKITWEEDVRVGRESGWIKLRAATSQEVWEGNQTQPLSHCVQDFCTNVIAVSMV